MAEEQVVERGPTPIEEIDLDKQVERHQQALETVSAALGAVAGELEQLAALRRVLTPLVGMLVIAADAAGTDFAEIMDDYSPVEVIARMYEILEEAEGS